MNFPNGFAKPSTASRGLHKDNYTSCQFLSKVVESNGDVLRGGVELGVRG